MTTPPSDAAFVAEYPLTWKHVQRGGYGYLLLTPCRLVKEGPKRVQIAVPLKSGGEKIRWVPREKVVGDDQPETHKCDNSYCGSDAIGTNSRGQWCLRHMYDENGDSE